MRGRKSRPSASTRRAMCSSRASGSPSSDAAPTPIPMAIPTPARLRAGRGRGERPVPRTRTAIRSKVGRSAQDRARPPGFGHHGMPRRRRETPSIRSEPPGRRRRPPRNWTRRRRTCATNSASSPSSLRALRYLACSPRSHRVCSSTLPPRSSTVYGNGSGAASWRSFSRSPLSGRRF